LEASVFLLWTTYLSCKLYVVINFDWLFIDVIGCMSRCLHCAGNNCVRINIKIHKMMCLVISVRVEVALCLSSWWYRILWDSWVVCFQL